MPSQSHYRLLLRTVTDMLGHSHIRERLSLQLILPALLRCPSGACVHYRFYLKRRVRFQSRFSSLEVCADSFMVRSRTWKMPRIRCENIFAGGGNLGSQT